MKAKFAGILAVGFLVVCAPAFAHHGNAEFESEKSVSLQATITEFVWGNPHSIVYFDVKNDKGQPVHWSCETAQPALLHRAGWNRDSLKPGDHVTVVAHQAKSGTPVGDLIKVVLANGQELKSVGMSHL